MNQTEAQTLLGRCHAALDAGDPQRELTALLRALAVSDQEIADAAHPDPEHPYGRRVLFATAALEAMVATWTRGAPCAPHDHGGAVGGVRVLRGEAIHRWFAVANGALRLTGEERVGAGDVLSCGPNLVHQMGDGGAAEPLVTLHLYHGPISHMVVYDTDGGRTLVVEGGCGAWLPWDEPHLIRRVVPGLRAPSELPAELA